MRQPLTTADEPFLSIRTLSVDYAAGNVEENHHHAWAQIIYAIRGAIRVEAKEHLWMLPQGRAILIPALCQHRLKMPGNAHLRTLYFNTDSFKGMALQGFSVSLLLHAAILRACELGWLDTRLPQDQTLADLIFNELKEATPALGPLRKPRDPRAISLMRAMMASENRALTIDDLCQPSGLSRRSAERLFEKETGQTPGRWRRTFLLSCAKEQLGDGLPIEEIVRRAGFKSRSAFNEAFKELTGELPGAAKRRLLRRHIT